MNDLLDFLLGEIPVVTWEPGQPDWKPSAAAWWRSKPFTTNQLQKQRDNHTIFVAIIQPCRRMDPKAARIKAIHDERQFEKPTFSQVAQEWIRPQTGAMKITQ